MGEGELDICVTLLAFCEMLEKGINGRVGGKWLQSFKKPAMSVRRGTRGMGNNARARRQWKKERVQQKHATQTHDEERVKKHAHPHDA